MLVAGLAAQAAMWAASHYACYLVSAALLVTVVATTSCERTTWSPARRRVGAATGLTACLGLIATCAADVVASALRDGKPPSTVDAIGALLIVAHLVQAATMTSRRDVALSAPLIAAMLLQAGIAATKSTPTIAPMVAIVVVAIVVVAIVAGMVSLAMLHRAELLTRAEAGVGLVAPARRALAQAGGAAACGALVFVLLPTSVHVGGHAQDRGSIGSTGSTASTGSVDLRAREIRSSRRDRVLAIPADVDMRATVSGGCRSSASAAPIAFYEDGRSCGGVVTFAAGGSSFEVRVNWLTGGVEVVAAP